ncbi:hypothetical protein [Microcystis phage Mae-JY09]
MRVMITGGLGLIGSALARDLAAADHQVVVVDDGRAAVTGSVPGTLIGRSVETIAPGWLGECDVVVHCAAPVGPVGILGRPVLAEMTSSTEAAIRLARQWSAALVVMSSSEVYGTRHPGDELVLPDEWSHRTEYAVGKIVTEQLARRHRHESDLPTMIVRPWNVVGPAQSAGKGFVIPRFAEQAIRGQRISVYRPGDQQRALMHVDDLAAALTVRIAGPHTGSAWDAVPLDAATPQNAVSMLDLAHRFAARVEVVDPRDEHGPEFREAHAGTKLPPTRPAIRGTTPLDRIIAESLDAARERLGVAA